MTTPAPPPPPGSPPVTGGPPASPATFGMPNIPPINVNVDHYKHRAEEIREEQEARGAGFKWDRPANTHYICGGDAGWRCCRLLGPYNKRGIIEKIIYKHWNIPGFKFPIPSLKTWGMDDPIDAVLTEVKNAIEANPNSGLKLDNRMWSAPEVYVNAIVRLFNKNNPGVATAEWDPEIHDKEHKGPAAVKPVVIALKSSLWNWVIGQLTTMFAQPQPINPANPDFGLDFYFTKSQTYDKKGEKRVEYKNPGFIFAPSAVVRDPALLAQIKASIVDLDIGFPKPPEETLQRINEAAQAVRAHYRMLSANTMVVHPGMPAPATTPPPAAYTPPPIVQPPAMTQDKFWINGPSGVVEATKSDVEATLKASPNLFDAECVMTHDQKSGWRKPADLGFMAPPPAAATPPPVAAPAPAPAPAAPVAPAAPATPAPEVKAERKFWVANNGAVQEITETELREKFVKAGGASVPVMAYDQKGGWKTAADFGITAEAAAPPSQPKPVPAPSPPKPVDFNDPAVAAAFGGIKGQYDGKLVNPLSRPIEHRIRPDNSVKLDADREYCFGLDHDPRRRGDGATEQGNICLICESETICRLTRVRRDPEFYTSIGWLIEGDEIISPKEQEERKKNAAS